jgi:uncharacterized protein
MVSLLRIGVPVTMRCMALAVMVFLGPVGSAEESSVPAVDGMVVRGETVEMPDGAKLFLDLYLPKGEGKFASVVLRTPYTTALGELANGVSQPGAKFAKDFVSQGYVFVLQDCRGTGRSEGNWDPWATEGLDGAELLKWIVKQPWSNGRVATFGSSYCGYTQWATATKSGDALKAMITEVPAFGWYSSNFVDNVFRLECSIVWNTLTARPHLGQESLVDIPPSTQAFVINLRQGPWDKVLRHLPLRTWDQLVGQPIPWVGEIIDRPVFDAYWAQRDASDDLKCIATPNLTITGWYDLFLNQALEYVPRLRTEAASETARRHQYLVIGPWGHMVNETGGLRDYGRQAQIDRPALIAQWCRQWLKGEDAGVDQWPFVRLFVMGANRWRDENEWPLARAQYTPLFFHGKGAANTLNGDGSLSREGPAIEPPDHYVYDPNDSVPTHGGEWSLRSPYGALDQREIESRADVLVYTSEPLTEPLEVTGPVKVILYAASSALDTDWTGKLVDVYPDGRAFNLCDGIARARYRESRTQERLLQPDEVCRFEIDLWATSNEFQPGHRIRVEISSSNFPRFDRNPNTGHKFGADAELVVARQTVYHDKEQPSHIVLPIIPR